MAHHFDLKDVSGSLISYCSQCGETKEFLNDPARLVDGRLPLCIGAPLAPAHADPAPVVTLSDESVEKLASAINKNRGGKAKTHRVSASGSASGIDTPPPVPDDTYTVGDRNMTSAQFMEAKRYYELFAEALKDKYPESGYSIMFNKHTGMCTVLGRKTSDQYKFLYDAETVKNHYCSFRLLDNNFDNYLATARSQAGTQNYGTLITPPSKGAVSVRHR